MFGGNSYSPTLCAKWFAYLLMLTEESQEAVVCVYICCRYVPADQQTLVPPEYRASLMLMLQKWQMQIDVKVVAAATVIPHNW